VAIVDEGRMIAMGASREIQDRAAGESTIEIECATALDGAASQVQAREKQITIVAERRQGGAGAGGRTSWRNEANFGLLLACHEITFPTSVVAHALACCGELQLAIFG
jgi:hypothetical protein